jgi:Protein of unknown function (DUF3301)
MELSWTLLAALCVAGVLVGFWHANLAAREAANDAARDACERLRLQFLDGTAAFARMRIARRADGWLALRRTYVFDYTSDSIARRQGFVALTGRRVDSVGFESEADRPAPARAVEPAAPPQDPLPPPPGGAPRGGGNVLDFERIRRHRKEGGTRRRQDG